MHDKKSQSSLIHIVPQAYQTSTTSQQAIINPNSKVFLSFFNRNPKKVHPHPDASAAVGEAPPASGPFSVAAPVSGRPVLAPSRGASTGSPFPSGAGGGRPETNYFWGFGLLIVVISIFWCFNFWVGFLFCICLFCWLNFALFLWFIDILVHAGTYWKVFRKLQGCRWEDVSETAAVPRMVTVPPWLLCAGTSEWLRASYKCFFSNLLFGYLSNTTI